MGMDVYVRVGVGMVVCVHIKRRTCTLASAVTAAGSIQVASTGAKFPTLLWLEYRSTTWPGRSEEILISASA